jgi:hypothetical protein
MADPTRLGGMKLSGELVQLDLLEPTDKQDALTELLLVISQANINIPHLHQTSQGNSLQTSLCIATEDYPSLKSTFLQTTQKHSAKLIFSMGTITLFPHKSSFRLMTLAYNLLVSQKIPVYGLSTSISALVIHTDFITIEKTAAILLKVFELPENHSPFRPDYTLKQVAKE